MRFEEAYEGCKSGCFTHAEASLLLGVCDRTFRRYRCKYDATFNLQVHHALSYKYWGQVLHLTFLFHCSNLQQV